MKNGSGLPENTDLELAALAVVHDEANRNCR